MQSPFRRRATAEADTAAEGTTEVRGTSSAERARARPRSYTPSKKELGKATPKRKLGGRAAEPPPANRREAARRMRAKQREARAEARAGMMAGKEEYLLPRDKGPERALVRDVVDARRNISTYFLPSALIVVVGSSQGMPEPIRLASNVLWAAIVLGVIADSVLLSRRVKAVLRQRFPKSTVKLRGTYWYAIMRSLSFRKMRMPAPRVKLGAKL